jgi:DNA-binding MarR family transcriptional regulator
MALWLEPYHLTSTEWACIGILLGGDTSPSHIAETLQVSPPMATKIIAKLKDRGIVERLDNTTDRRSTLIVLSASGHEKAHEIEDVIRNGMRQLMAGVSREHLLSYLVVLHYLADLPTPLKLS